MKKRFQRKKLFSEKSFHRLVGYARAIDNEVDYLNQQINSLKKFGCNIIFSEILEIGEKNKPELEKAFEYLSRGDELVLTKLDRAFQSRSDCIITINKLLNDGINITTLSGFLNTNNSHDILRPVFNFLLELDIIENNSLIEKKANIKDLKIRGNLVRGNNLGGRPKISSLKESLVLRLRNEGFSYRSIRSQTGIALSTIRRVILDSEVK